MGQWRRVDADEMSRPAVDWCRGGDASWGSGNTEYKGGGTKRPLWARDRPQTNPRNPWDGALERDHPLRPAARPALDVWRRSLAPTG
jgi:hypothetical protein